MKTAGLKDVVPIDGPGKQVTKTPLGSLAQIGARGQLEQLDLEATVRRPRASFSGC